MTLPVTGLILAGGESRRFGADKALHVVRGRPMVEHVYHTIRQVADPVLVSVRSDDERARALPGRVVEDRFPGKGPLAGLQAGLRVMKTPWLLAAACDMPFLTVEALKQLVAHCSEEGGAVVARAPDGRRHPLCACYHATVLPVVEAALHADRLALRQLLGRLAPTVYVELPAAVVRNVNCPEDVLSSNANNDRPDTTPNEP